MSRSGYSSDCDGWDLVRWRGAVRSAIRGKRGQAFLQEMLVSLDSLPAKRLIKDNLIKDGEVCAIGSVGLKRNIDMSGIEENDRTTVAQTFAIAGALAAEIASINDSDFVYCDIETPEERFIRVRKWVVQALEEYRKI